MKKNTTQLKGQLAAISQSLATLEQNRPSKPKDRHSKFMSYFYVKRQLNQTDKLLESLNVSLAHDIEKIKKSLS